MTEVIYRCEGKCPLIVYAVKTPSLPNLFFMTIY